MSTMSTPFLDQVSARIDDVLWRAPVGSLPSSSLEHAARALLQSPHAKRARALLVSQVGALVDAPAASWVDFAAAVEMIHAASLLHDDVVDQSGLRRGLPTANAEHGNAFAVLCGDLVLSRAMQLLTPWGNAVVTDGIHVVEEMTRAALVEVEDRGSFDVPLSRWRAMAEGKTGALFAFCGVAPCRVVDDGARAARLARAFRGVGVAFQIVDDLNDLSGADRTKPRGQDVREKNPSLPILLALQHDRDLAARVAAARADVDVDAACEAVLARAKDAAVAEARRAVDVAVVDLGDDAARLAALVGWARHLVDEAAQ